MLVVVVIMEVVEVVLDMTRKIIHLAQVVVEEVHILDLMGQVPQIPLVVHKHQQEE